MTFAELQSALILLGFEDRVTLRQIKERFRSLARQYHPDLGSDDKAHMELLNQAYAMLLEYCDNYRISFAEDEFYLQNPDAHLRRQFSDDPLWGK